MVQTIIVAAGTALVLCFVVSLVEDFVVPVWRRKTATKTALRRKK